MASEKKYLLRCSIFGHSVDVRSLKPVVVPGGGMVSGSRDKTIKVWKPTESDSGFVEAHCMMGPTHFIASLCTLPPSTQYPSGLILAGSNDCAIYGFSLETSQPLLKLLGHSDTVCALASGKFGTFVSGSWDKSARMWLGQKCLMTLVGHQAAVWAVAIFPDGGLTLTGSADKTIRLWHSGKCEKVFYGHQDCVRGLVVVSSFEFLSCSNDSTVRMWQTNGNCIHVFSGHANYIYGIALINDMGDFVTCSEDRTIKIWRKGSCFQTIRLPAKTLWTVAALKNEDIAVGGSDGSIRVFTKHGALMASPQEIHEYEKEVVLSHKGTKKDKFGDLNIDNVPGMEALSVPGTSDGQTTLCSDGEAVYGYQWSQAAYDWIKMADASEKEQKKELFEGKEYDYVFSIEVEDEKYLKLPFNVGDNPWMAAQKFIEKHNLSQLFLHRIADFISSNTPETSVNLESIGSDFLRNTPEPAVNTVESSDGNVFSNTVESHTIHIVQPSDICDPFTGHSRYIPGSTTSRQPSKVVFTPYGDCGESKANTYYPMTTYLRFDTSNFEGLKRKLFEFNDRVAPNLKVSVDEINDLLLLADFPDTVTEQQMATLDKVMSWPSDCVFPALDLFRLAVRSDIINQKVSEAGGVVITNYLLRHIQSVSSDENKMLAIRTFCNFFGHSTGDQLLAAHVERICAAAGQCMPTTKKNIQIAVATLYLNYAVALNKDLVFDAELVTGNALNILEVLSDPEACFRMLVAVGTLLGHVAARKCIKQHSSLQSVLNELVRTGSEDKVKACAEFILEDLS